MARIASGLTPAAPPAATTAAAITTENNSADIKSSTNNGDNSVAPSTCNAQRMESFRASLERYISGHEIDPSPCYIALEAAIANPGIGQAAQESRDELMVLLMNCVEGETVCVNTHFIVNWMIVETLNYRSCQSSAVLTRIAFGDECGKAVSRIPRSLARLSGVPSRIMLT